ncbi:flagellar biosynthesis protein FlhB [Parvularcula sp. ZS-1/3]|uniref:Flagellar biosynthesis protein FlhB n=1 Tax=Parvularcula mediterranea TaxID=2732508 RepID=A0A7Y3W4K7_9PROT|nr:flagellar biosynthesis protein FlhB [Parvularcula mediterranea]
MSDDAADKVEPASQGKKERAKKKGDVPVSQEANTAAALAGFVLALAFAAAGAAGFSKLLRGFLLHPEEASTALLEGGMTGKLSVEAMLFLVPLAAVPGIAVILALGLQQSIVFAPQRIKPSIDKISPLKNAGKKFGPQALLEFAKNSLKAVVLSIVSGIFLWIEANRVALQIPEGRNILAVLLMRELLLFVGIAFAVSAVFALIDIPIVRAQREKRLKMSHQETKDERKDSEGDQDLKAKRRMKAQEIANQRMMEDVKTADVLLMNPTHYAVALKWDRSGEDLPKCVAKGTDEVALRLRAAASEAGVPVREDPPSARSLHATVGVGEAIKPEHFAAVAAAIRFADRIRALRRRG